MKRFVFLPLLALAVLATAVRASEADTKLAAELQGISVTIRAGRAQGSGVIYTREVGKDTVSFVWTAGHVVDGLRKVRSVIDPKGGEKSLVEFDDAKVVQEFNQDGRRIGEVNLDARVLRYSDAEQGEDLALLLIRKRNFAPVTTSAQFYLDEATPSVGTELCHVGSLLGQFGANSYTTGVLSQIGRVLDLGANGVVFDQTTVTAFPGSSGGGVFLKADGRYVGMLVRGAGEQFNFIVPVRRMRDWAARSKIEWAIDPNIPVPTTAELAKLPIEDAGIPEWSAALTQSGDRKPREDGFDYLIKRLPEPEPVLAPSPIP